MVITGVAMVTLAIRGTVTVFALCILLILGAVIVGRVGRGWMSLVRSLLPIIMIVGAMDIAYAGLAHGLILALRFVVVASLFGLFFLTTSLDDVAAALTAWRVPYSFGFVLVAGARYLPTMAQEASEIIDAYRARGIFQERTLLDWVSLYARILIPLVASTVRRSLRLGEAMEVRGYGRVAHPTSLVELSWSWRDSVVTVLVCGSLVLAAWLP